MDNKTSLADIAQLEHALQTVSDDWGKQLDLLAAHATTTYALLES